MKIGAMISTINIQFASATLDKGKEWNDFIPYQPFFLIPTDVHFNFSQQYQIDSD